MSTLAQFAGVVKVVPPSVLTSRTQATAIGVTVTLLVSRAVTVVPWSVTPLAVTMFCSFSQRVTAGTTHWAVAPAARTGGNPQALRLRSGSDTVSVKGRLPVFCTVIR